MRVWTTARQGQVRRDVWRERGAGGGFAAIVLGGGGGGLGVIVANRGLVELRVSN